MILIVGKSHVWVSDCFLFPAVITHGVLWSDCSGEPPGCDFKGQMAFAPSIRCKHAALAPKNMCEMNRSAAQGVRCSFSEVSVWEMTSYTSFPHKIWFNRTIVQKTVKLKIGGGPESTSHQSPGGLQGLTFQWHIRVCLLHCGELMVHCGKILPENILPVLTVVLVVHWCILNEQLLWFDKYLWWHFLTI